MNITRGKRQEAQKVVIYGVEGVGKSTFASHFPDPIFIDTEGSTGALDVARTDPPQSFAQLLDQVQYFILHPDQLGTLIIDTADWAEQLAIADICMENKWRGIEDAGYGKGYVYVGERFGKLLAALDALRAQGVTVVMTAHAQIRKFEQPDEMGAYDRWELKLTKRTAPMVKEWASLLLFANYKTYVVAANGKAKATGGTKRVMYTEHTASWDAKNRAGLAPELPFEYAQIAHLIPTRQAAPSAPQAANPAQDAPTPATPPAYAPKPRRTGKPTSAKKTADSGAQTPTAASHADAAAAPGIPPALAELMAAQNVKPGEIRAVVAQRGYYPADTPIDRYDPAFIKAVLIGAWPQVEAMIQANRRDEDEDMPF